MTIIEQSAPTVSVQRALAQTHVEHTKHSDGYVQSILVDQLGFEILSVETYRRDDEPSFADAVCRNMDTIYEKMGWD